MFFYKCKWFSFTSYNIHCNIWLCIFWSTFIIKMFVIRPVYKTKKKEKQKGVATYMCTTLSRYNHSTMLNVQDYNRYNNVTLIDRNSKCPKQYRYSQIITL